MTENCIQKQNILVNILSLVKAVTFHDTPVKWRQQQQKSSENKWIAHLTVMNDTDMW